MSVKPPPKGSSSNDDEWLDAAWGVFAPYLLLTLLTSALSASFALKVPLVKGIGSLILCAVSFTFLFFSSSENGGSATRWRLEPRDWAQLALTAHTAYFGLIHDFISK